MPHAYHVDQNLAGGVQQRQQIRGPDPSLEKFITEWPGQLDVTLSNNRYIPIGLAFGPSNNTVSLHMVFCIGVASAPSCRVKGR
jgi:hypothetical protein